MKIPLYLLETLSILSEEQSLVKTAQRLQTTQPTVSRQLKQLQGYFKSPLFENQGRNKKLTALGKKISARMQERLEGLEVSLQEALLEDEKLENLRLRIGGRFEILRRLIAPLDFPCQLEMISMESADITSALNNLSLDLAISQQEVPTNEYIRKILFKDEWCLIVPRKFTKDSLSTWNELCSAYPYAAYISQWPLGKMLVSAASISEYPQEAFVFSDWETIEKRVQNGLNWAIVPSSFVQENRSYQILTLKTSLEKPFYIYMKKSLRKHALLDFILEKT